MTAILLAACGSSHYRDASAPADDGAIPADGTLGVDGSALPPDGCLPLTAVACDCPGGREGFRYCTPDRTWGECECPPVIAPIDAGTRDGGVHDAGASAGCTGDPEWCDGRDNDCDGVVDNGHPCPDSSVRNTVPFSGTVYFRGSLVGGSCNRTYLRRLWPSVGPDEFANLPCSVGHMLFDPRDDTLLYGHRGVRRYLASGFEEVETPPCFDAAVGPFGIDGSGRMYYRCGDTIRRGAGELLPIGSFDGYTLAVHASGHTIAGTGREFVLASPDGTVVSYTDVDNWVGQLRPMAGISIEAGSAFVSFRRRHSGSRYEIVVFTANTTSGEWRLVRRVPLRAEPEWAFAVPNGTVLAVDRSDRSTIIEYPPDGPARVVFRADESIWAIDGALPGPQR